MLKTQTLTFKQTLSPNFLPPKLFFREPQLERMQSPENHYCEGDRSTGKTVTALKLVESYKSRNLTSQNRATVYFRTDRAIMLEFRRAVSRTIGSVTARQNPMVTLCGRTPQPFITIVIDDAQKILRYRVFNDFLHSLYEDSLEGKKHLQLLILGTTKYPEFLQQLRDDVASRFQFKPIVFPRYNAHEINKILKQRLDLANISYEESAINYISAIMTSRGSDLRLAFEILHTACTLSFSQKKPLSLNISKKVVEQAWEKTQIDYWTERLSGMDLHSQLLLFAATAEAQRHMLSSLKKEPEVTTSQITQLYRKICYDSSIEPLYAQRIYYQLGQLTRNGWLTKTSVIREGRYARTSVFRFEMNPVTIINAFDRIKELSVYLEPHIARYKVNL